LGRRKEGGRRRRIIDSGQRPSNASIAEQAEAPVLSLNGRFKAEAVSGGFAGGRSRSTTCRIE
jgi:hypothetical protein